MHAALGLLMTKNDPFVGMFTLRRVFGLSSQELRTCHRIALKIYDQQPDAVANSVRLPVERRIMRHTIIAIAAAALAIIPGAQAQTIEADNGAVYHILRTMHYSDGTAQAAISTPDADEIGWLAVGSMDVTRGILIRTIVTAAA